LEYIKIREKNIGNTPIDIRENNLVVGDKECEGTPGLWELVISKTTDISIYSHNDLDNYAQIMVETNALKQNNNPTEVTPKSSKGRQWKIFSEIYGGKEVNTKGRAFLQPL